MCGFTGFLSTTNTTNSSELLHTMNDTIIHRGPNDSGIWHDNVSGIGLAHRRLSIVDISPAGHQPMQSQSARYIIAFNGEIYNHLSLRDELNKYYNFPTWRGHSDTETLLAGFDAWGIEVTIKKAIGMFAFAVWDKQTLKLTLGRDRLGEKPLYYGWQSQGGNAFFLFGSELKALKAHPAFENTINRTALSLQLRYNYIPAPYSIYKGIAKLRQGCLLTVSLNEREPKEWEYWSAFHVANSGAANPFIGSTEELIEDLEFLLNVNLLETIQVTNHHGQRGPLPFTARQFAIQVQEQRPGIGQPRQVVGGGGVLHGLVLQGVLDGKPQLGAYGEENAEVIWGERIPLPPVETQHADGPLHSFQRHGQRGKRQRRGTESFQEAGLHQGVSVNDGFALFRHPTTQAFADGNA